MRLLFFIFFIGSSLFAQSERSSFKEKAYEKYMDLVKPKASVLGNFFYNNNCK